ncbi:uncharacterized protein LOC131189908 [Ahaetulla prasina]|uniref:uncharacterized protein LOC131189908 n=1 Tax=Ahaetulla prasina TaxID=499056 RepID=UPI002649D1E3|nr:uncharacterized protein LOC131189908 [Ahaetulla prasina]
MTYTNLYLATTTKKQLNQLTGSHYPDVQSWFRQHIFSTEVKENRQCRRDTESGDLQTAKLYLKQTHPVMAPWIRLSLAKPLPTISEAFEDILEDITSSTNGFGNVYMDPDSCSVEDHCQSNFQLARSAFLGSLESKHQFQDKKGCGMLPNSQKILNLSESPQMVSRCTLPKVLSLQQNSFIHDYIKTYSASGRNTLEDPYEGAQKTSGWKCPVGSENMGTDCTQSNFHNTYAVTPQEKMSKKQPVASLPRYPSPRPSQRENGCQEQKYSYNQDKVTALESSPNPNHLPVNGKSIWLHPTGEAPPTARDWRSSQRGQHSLKTTGSPEKECLKSSTHKQSLKGETDNRNSWVEYFHIDKKITGRDWIAEYQSAWKEAKGRACLLPAIEES